MDWKIVVAPVAASEFPAAVDAIVHVGEPQSEGDATAYEALPPHVQEQVSHARDIVKDIVARGAFGDGNKQFHVHVNGHANEGHTEIAGEPLDYINISLKQYA